MSKDNDFKMNMGVGGSKVIKVKVMATKPFLFFRKGLGEGGELEMILVPWWNFRYILVRGQGHFYGDENRLMFNNPPCNFNNVKHLTFSVKKEAESYGIIFKKIILKYW